MNTAKIWLHRVVVALVVVLSMQPIYGFSDLDPTDASTEAIEAFYARGLINGYPDGTFRPQGSLTRAEFITLINRTFGYTEPATGTASFKDVPETAWYKKDLDIAVERGYIAGYPDGTFRPDYTITRAETAVLLNRILKYEALAYVELSDGDADWSLWAFDAVQSLVSHGIMSVMDGRFDGGVPIARNATVVSLLSVLQKQEAAATPTPTPTPVTVVPIDGGFVDGGGGAVSEEPETEAPTAEVITALNKTIAGLDKVLARDTQYAQALDNDQMDMVEDTQSAMKSYLKDYDFDYDGAAAKVQSRYSKLVVAERNEIKNAISASVPYKYLKTLEDFFGDE